MSLRERLRRLLGRGHAEELGPDSIVELVNVPLHQGPRVLDVLKNAGIEASGVESVDVVTEATTRLRVFVRQADVTRAAALLENYGHRYGSW